MPFGERFWRCEVLKSTVELGAAGGFTSAMTLEAIEDAVQTQPFRAFSVRLATGAQIKVESEARIGIHSEGKTFVKFLKGGGYRIVDIPLVTDLLSN